MKELVGDRLPEFSEEEKQLLENSADFFGLNHYTSIYATNQDVPTGLFVLNL
jgi:beta-glucosidase